MLTARDIMTTELVTIRPDWTVQDAIELLLAERISGLPVVERDGRLVGIVSEFALLAIAYDSSVMKEFVAQHMTTDVLSVDLDDPIRKVADLCIAHRVRRVPVMEHGRMVGIIARRDVLKAVYDMQTAEHVASTVTAR